MPNEIAVSRQQVLAHFGKVISEGIIPRSGDAIPTRAKADSKRVFDQIRNEAGEDVFEAAEQIWGDYAAALANGDLDATLAALEEAERPEPRVVGENAPEILALEDLTPEERGLILVAGALAPRRDADGVDVHRAPERQTQWHKFTATAPDSRAANHLRINAPAIFNHMPCFANLSRTHGPRAVDQMKVAVNYNLDAARAANPGERALIAGPAGQHMRRLAQATEDDVANIGGWIRDNALRMQANKMRFRQMFGYEPDVVFAVSEDESFLLVRERKESGSPVEGQSIYAWPGGRQYYAQNPGELQKLVALMTAKDGIEIDFSPAGARRALQDKLPAPKRPAQQQLPHRQEMPVPEMNGREREPVARPAPQPQRARPAPQAPAPQQARPAPRAAAQPAAPAQEAPQPAAAPAPAPKAPPVTRALPHKPTAARVGRFTALGTLRQDLGFEMGLVPARTGGGMEQAAYKQDESGFVVIFATDGKKLPLASEFVVERREDLQVAGDELGSLSSAGGKDDFVSTLESFSSGAGFRP